MDLDPTIATRLATGSMLLGGGLLAYGVARLLVPVRGQKAPAAGDSTQAGPPQLELVPVEEGERHLINLARRVGWVEVDDDTAYWDDVRNYYGLWRKPHPLTSPDRPLYVNDPSAEKFYNEYVRGSATFNRLELHRMVIIQLLELLDGFRKEPSVVVKDVLVDGHLVGDAEDDKYDRSSFQLLSKVSLYEHTINVARNVCVHLRKQRYDFRIPTALIAALAHDLGKAKTLRQGRNSREHPAISCEVLHSLEGFSQLRSHKEILGAVRSHHTGTVNTWLAKLLQSADHQARREEYEEQLKTRQTTAVGEPWFAQYKGPQLKDMVRQIPIAPPTAQLPCDIPPFDIYQEEPEMTDGEALLATQAEAPPTPGDALLDKVARWVEQTDLDEYSVDVIREEFQVSSARAEKLFSELVAMGLLVGETPTPSPTPPAPPAPQEPGPEETATGEAAVLAAMVPESDVVFAPRKQRQVVFPAVPPPAPVPAVPQPEPEYGTKSAADDPPKTDVESARQYEEITPWFIAERFLEKLRSRVNVDKITPREDNKGGVAFCQAVTVGKELYVHIRGFKEILADLMHEHGDQEAAQRILVKPERGMKELHEEQSRIFNQVLRYFRENGGVNTKLVPEGCAGMWCHIEMKGYGVTKRYWMLPFLLDELYPADQAEALRRRKNPKDNPYASRVLKVTPQTLLGIRGG